MAPTRTPKRRPVPPVAAAVIQPVTKRLARIEALLLEMRFEMDVKLRRIVQLREKVEVLAERVTEQGALIRRLSPGRRRSKKRA